MLDSSKYEYSHDGSTGVILEAERGLVSKVIIYVHSSRMHVNNNFAYQKNSDAFDAMEQIYLLSLYYLHILQTKGFEVYVLSRVHIHYVYFKPLGLKYMYLVDIFAP